MGMFDSFYTNEGKEIQTKKLDCGLSRYYVGDTVPNYELNFDGATGNYYLIEEYDNASVIVINNIFLDYLVEEDSEKLKANTNHIFRSYLSNPTLLSLKLSNIIKEKLNLQRTVLTKNSMLLNVFCANIRLINKIQIVLMKKWQRCGIAI